MQDSIEAFGIAVRIARKKRKLTQKQLAEKLHMSEHEVQAYISICQQVEDFNSGK